MHVLLHPFVHRWTSRLTPEQRKYCFNVVTTCHSLQGSGNTSEKGNRKKELELGGGAGAPGCCLVGVAASGLLDSQGQSGEFT